eukprot:1112247-Prorocentrum_minimum.AAC.2
MAVPSRRRRCGRRKKGGRFLSRAEWPRGALAGGSAAGGARASGGGGGGASGGGGGQGSAPSDQD